MGSCLTRVTLIRILLCMAAFLGLWSCTTWHVRDPHGHVVDVHEKPWTARLAPNMRLVKVLPPAESSRRDIILNPSGTIRAYIVEKTWSENFLRDHMHLDYLSTGETFEIEGVPMEHRPYSDLVWVGDDLLAFDRWSMPHYGMHYVVDTARKEILVAAPFPDQFYLDLDKAKEQTD